MFSLEKRRGSDVGVSWSGTEFSILSKGVRLPWITWDLGNSEIGENGYTAQRNVRKYRRSLG